ncbi:MAG TPA: DUF5667 domain-containing protein [Candidatus Limnocylindria bacterium]|nr:DUF5667 domain-containing protein [Candidatus Limnocylindria bacterium]
MLGSVRPRRPTFADGAAVAFELLAKPAPYAVRAIATVAIVAAIVTGAGVAGADTLPDDPLYAFKLAGEDLRLALAQSSEDRAAVQLSIAEHRLAEAERLASNGQTEGALVASSTYSEHVARAAAELSQLEAAQPFAAALLTQLDDRYSVQRSRVQTLATKLSSDPATVGASEVLAVVAAPTLAPGRNEAERVAETAAGVAQDLANVAAARVAAPAPARQVVTEPARPNEASRASDAPRASVPARTIEPPKPAAAPAAGAPTTEPARVVTVTTQTATTKDQAAKVADTARKAADEARAAADKAKAGKAAKPESKDKRP